MLPAFSSFYERIASDYASTPRYIIGHETTNGVGIPSVETGHVEVPMADVEVKRSVGVESGGRMSVFEPLRRKREVYWTEQD